MEEEKVEEEVKEVEMKLQDEEEQEGGGGNAAAMRWMKNQETGRTAAGTRGEGRIHEEDGGGGGGGRGLLKYIVTFTVWHELVTIPGSCLVAIRP